MRFWSEFIWLLRRIETVRATLVSQINSAINSEALTRQTADTTEKNARIAADNELNTKINNRLYVQSGTPTTSASDPIPEGSFWFKVVS